MKERVKEESMLTIALTLAGFAGLIIAVPDWARAGVAIFAAIFCVLAYVLDANVRSALRLRVAKSAPAKSPGGRPAAT